MTRFSRFLNPSNWCQLQYCKRRRLPALFISGLFICSFLKQFGKHKVFQSRSSEAQVSPSSVFMIGLTYRNNISPVSTFIAFHSSTYIIICFIWISKLNVHLFVVGLISSLILHRHMQRAVFFLWLWLENLILYTKSTQDSRLEKLISFKSIIKHYF